MADRLTDAELKRVVAEVNRLALDREAELDRQQVQAILQDLSLPPELLDQALVQLHRQDALVVQARRRRWITVGVVAVLVVGLSAFFFSRQQQRQAFDQVTAIQDQVALGSPNGPSVSPFNRQDRPELFYRVTLEAAPVGQRLPLLCNWLDPTTQIVHQNRYQTQSIETPVWNTHCRFTLDPSTQPGTWEVQIFLDGRPLESQSFEVR